MSEEEPKLETVRDEAGRWVKGAPTPNARGRGAGRETWMTHADRVDYILNKYTRGQIKQMAIHPDQIDDLPLKDALIMQNIINALQSDGGTERERIYSRLFGEPIKRSELTGADGAELFNNESARAEVRSKLLSPIAASDTGTTAECAERPATPGTEV